MNKLKSLAFVFLGLIGLGVSVTQSARASIVTVDAAVSECSETKELYCPGKKLVDLVDMSMSIWQKFGASTDERVYTYSYGPLGPEGGTFKLSGLYLWDLSADSNRLTVEFQGHTYNSYGGVGNGFTLTLTQEGDDIYGQITHVCGFTGSDGTYGTSWDSRPVGNGAYNRTNLYSCYASALRLTFDIVDNERTVTVLDKTGATVKIIVLGIGETDARSQLPTAAEMATEGFLFVGWDADVSNVTADVTVRPLYHQLFTVVFKDADGTVLSTQTVEETESAEEPDMTGKTLDGNPFLGWDVNFSNVSDDLVVTAFYGTLPDTVRAAVETGLLPEDDDTILIWGEAGDGTWNGETRNWYTANGQPKTWTAGKTAVFAASANVTVSGAQSVGKIMTVADATSVVFTGDAVTVSSVDFKTAGTVRFECNVTSLQSLAGTSAVAGATIEIAGDCSPASGLVLDGVLFKTVGTGTLGGGSLTASVAISNDAVLSLGSSERQLMKGAITVASKNHGYVITEPGSDVSFESDIGKDWELRVGGVTETSKYNSLPRAGGGMTKVLAGGNLKIGSTNTGWGPQVWSSEGVTVERDGRVTFTQPNSMGVIMGYVIDGGIAVNESADPNMILYKWELKDGATLTGTKLRVGYIDYYETWSWIKATGAAPSTVSLDAIEIGYQGPASNEKYVGINFIVSDVTGDVGSDLIVSSPIIENAAKATFAEGYRNNLGVRKTGPGTVELTARGSSAATGVFRFEEGTVRFGENATGDFGSLVVMGDSTLDICKDAKVTFDAPGDLDWTEGKVLNLTGVVRPTSIRVGTSASLTEAQLAQIKYVRADGKAFAVTQSAAGYLLPPPSGFVLQLR